jgi:hypothetical protein
MRVGHRRRGERGAVLVIVAAFCIVAVIFTAFVVDIGNQRQNRRQLATASDSAALDVAQEWTELNLATTGFTSAGGGAFDCSSINGGALAQSVVLANNDGKAADTVTCLARVGTFYGVVTVGTTEAVEYEFGKAVGINEGGTGAVTSVRITSTSNGGLRPFSLCVDYPGVKEWIAEWTDGDDEEPPPTTIDVLQLKALHPDCVQAAGNWGAGDFSDEPEFTGGGANALGQALNEGSYKAWKTSTSESTCAETTPVSCMDALTGAKWNSQNITTALGGLEGDDGNSCATGGPTFYIPTYGEAVSTGGGGGGTKVGYPITGFAQVQLQCYEVKGSDLNKFVLKFISYDQDGPCCSYATGQYRLDICDVGTIGGSTSSDFSSSCAFAAYTPPNVGEDTDAEPDPSGCVVSGAAKLNSPTQSGNKLSADLQLELSVADAAKCSAIDVRVQKVNNPSDSLESTDCCTATGNKLRLTVPRQDSKFKWNATAYEVVVFDAAGDIAEFELTI